MTIMTSREFNQNVSLAQKQALIEPVMITNRGKPSHVLMSYENYLSQQLNTDATPLTIAQALGDMNPDSADIDFELPPRSKAQRPSVEL